MTQKITLKGYMIGLGLVTVLGFLLALGLGQYQIPPATVLRVLIGADTAETVKPNIITTIFNVRLPRILLSLLAGAGLAAAGAAFQSLFANPLATPDTLGVANGASFGAALGLLFGFGSLAVQGLSLLFGLSAVALVFAVNRTAGRGNSSLLMVILSGMVISSLFSALVSLIKYVADPQDTLPVITFWLMGRFSGVTRKTLTMSLPLISAGTLLIFLLRFRLNVLSLPEEEARSMGIHLKRLRAAVILAAAMTTAAVVSACGVIGWVGLLVPHICRLLFGNDNRRVVPAAILSGAFFMLFADTLARCATASEIPVSILTAVIGAPVFIALMRKGGGLR